MGHQLSAPASKTGSLLPLPGSSCPSGMQPCPLSEQIHLRGLWGFTTLPGKVCVVENILLCLHIKSQIWSVLKSVGHHTQPGGGAPPPPGSSPPPSTPPAIASENPERSIPQREAAAGNQEGA